MTRVDAAGSLRLEAVKGEPPGQAAKHSSGQAGAKQETLITSHPAVASSS